MSAEEWLRDKGIYPTEPIYWEFVGSTISLNELLEEYAEYKQLQNTSSNRDYEKCDHDYERTKTIAHTCGKCGRVETFRVIMSPRRIGK